jgi:hypothetical protein
MAKIAEGDSTAFCSWNCQHVVVKLNELVGIVKFVS